MVRAASLRDWAVVKVSGFRVAWCPTINRAEESAERPGNPGLFLYITQRGRDFYERLPWKLSSKPGRCSVAEERRRNTSERQPRCPGSIHREMGP